MVERLSPDEAFELMRDAGYIYVDVRDEDEFADGHPEGAYNVPFVLAASGETPDFIEVCTRAFGKDAKLIVGCKSGVRSLSAARALAEAGFRNVKELRPGFFGARGPFGEKIEPGWNASQPVERGTPPARGYRDLLRS